MRRKHCGAKKIETPRVTKTAKSQERCSTNRFVCHCDETVMNTASLLSNLLASEKGFDTSLDCVLGRNPAVRKIARHAERAAEAECTVLVSGETGTGKE